MAQTGSKRWLVLLSLALPAAPARAQEGAFELGAAPAIPMPPPLTTSFVEAGVGTLDTNAFHLGRYGGPNERGLFPVFRAVLDGGDAWDSGGARMWNGAVDIFGRDTVAAHFRFGNDPDERLHHSPPRRGRLEVVTFLRGWEVAELDRCGRHWPDLDPAALE
ncbi:MAG: hypothetical protein Q8N51_17380, partial [Gammaproteobacteria bacterium]|nr:hypothetical protein [Gammaproteobacteria bacterium]